ncbi:hypothetical protein WJX72_007078 [[Myrmecia] bisecta]|uniref:MATH domain-containing protein n=1 Tax=[Myrmecia] bisecta TaxID=41462 RepID=A0AAW1R7N5_9CHLO
MGELALATATARPDASGEEADGGIVIDRKNAYAAGCKWAIANFSKCKQRTLWSKYFEVGGYDCRLLVYPQGDSQALPGYVSIYLQVTDPGGASGKWDCFASYRLCVVNQLDDSRSIARDSWHRYSSKKKSHGWCDFTPAAALQDGRQGFALSDTVIVTADILLLNESVSFSREADLSNGVGPASPEVLSGKFTWKVHNFPQFLAMMKTQKVMSPVFPAGECNLRLSVYQSTVGGTEYLSKCLESRDADKAGGSERSCWCLFRMSVLNQLVGGKHLHRDSYGRFAADSKAGDNTSLGWNDFMPMANFIDSEQGYTVDGTAIFSASFHIIKESSTFTRNFDRSGSLVKGRGKPKGAGGGVGGDGGHQSGKFTWKIEHFTRLKELLKKRKITGLCIKSKRFQVGGRDCRLIVYPRGQSQPPCHLSMFLEVTDPRSTSPDWSCFVSHRLSVVNQRAEGGEKSVSKESQNRYSKAAKDWGWREFVTLTSLFDQDAGYLVNDAVVFSAEVLVLRESSEAKLVPVLDLPEGLKAADALEYGLALASSDNIPNKVRFSWRIENFVAFKEIMETRKIFSKYFTAEGCELRIGVYESFDTLCIYLESDAQGASLERNFWVKYRIAVVNQKHPERTEWKESAICTKTWNNSVLQFMKVHEMVDAEQGYLHKESLVLMCEVLECCPWFEFADLEVYASDAEGDGVSTDADDLLDSDGSEGGMGDEEELFRSLLARAGVQLGQGHSWPVMLDSKALTAALHDKLLMDATSGAAFLAGMRVYLDDPLKAKRLLLPTVSTAKDGQQTWPCVLDLLMAVHSLQQPLIDLMLDVMVDACECKPRKEQPISAAAAASFVARHRKSVPHLGSSSASDGPSGGASADRATPGLDISRCLPDGRGDGAECASASSTTAGLTSALPSVHSFGSLVGSTSAGEALSMGGPLSTPPSPSPAAKASAGGEDGQDPASASSAVSGKTAAQDGTWWFGGAGPASGAKDAPAASTSGREKAQYEEVLALAVSWLRTLDPLVCQNGASAGGSAASPRPPAMQKITALLSGLPRALQADMVMLVPKLVDASEHTALAGALLARLAEANREGPEAEVTLRMPVLAALGLLRIDPAIAQKVLRAALESLPALSESELPPAVGLVLKLASDSPKVRSEAVGAVRQRVRSAHAETVTPGTLDALRLAVTQYKEVAQAMLADIDASCKALAKAGRPVSTQDGDSLEAPAALHVADLEVLMDLLAQPSLRRDTERVFEQGVVLGLVSESEVAAVLERRRMQHLVASSMPPPRFSPDLLPQMPFFTPLSYLPNGLPSLPNLPSLGFPWNGLSLPLASGSDFENMQNATVQIEALQKRITRLEAAQRKAAEQAQQEAAKAAAEAAGLKQKLVEYEVEIARHHSERKTEVAGFSSGKKELQDKIRNLESELDWVRAERADEQAAAAKDKKELTGRVKELESAASRAKTVRRDEVKRLTKEKAQLADRLKELESAQPRLEEELGRLRLAVTSGAEQRQKAEQEAEAKLRKTEGELQQKAEQVKRFEAYVESADAKVRAQQDYIAGLERNLQEQLARVAPLYGANLDALTAGQLDALARIHEEGLKRARTLSAQRRHEEGAAAVAVAAVEAVTGPGNLGNLGNAGNLGPKTSMPASRSGQRNLGSIGSMESVSSVSSMGSLAAASAALGNNDRQGSLAGLGGERLPHGLMDNPSRQSPSRSMFFSGNGNNAFSQQNTPIVSTGFPAGFPNGLLGGTGLMNGHHPSSNGSHQLW